MTTNTNAALPDIPAAGAKALSDYLKDCEANAIQPDIGGAFAYAFMAGAALTTAAAVPPEGWVMVPVEPTEEMKAAAVKYANGPAVYKNVRAEVLRIEEGIYGEAYEAMLASAPKATPVPVVEQEELREGASYESMNLAVMVLSDCGHSSNYKPLLERVAGRIDRHVERLLTAQHADRAMRAQAAPAAQGDAPTDSGPISRQWLTVVYRGVEAGDEVQQICTHPKVSAMSWSHAIHDRDAARSQAKEGGA